MGLTVTFGKSVRQTRLAKGMTLEALAHEVGLSYSYVGEIERGRRNPTLLVVERISLALGEDPIRLLSGAHPSG
jgi:transcriptional regulator with XRE-family HTH domain